MNPTRCTLLFALASTLSAQVATFPSDHATVPDGEFSQYWMPYSYGVSRMQTVYESWDLHIPAGRQITRIGFRAESSLMSTGYALQLEVRMGRTTGTAASLDATFDNNWSAPPTTVFGPAIFQLPDLNNPNRPNPDAPNVWLNLTTPYTYNPSENLLIEWRVLANSNGSAGFSYWLDSPGFLSAVSSGPQGCPHSGGPSPVLTSQPTRVGGPWYVYLQNAPASQLAVLVINAGSQLTSPFSLQPFVPGIAPGCLGQVTPGNALTLVDFTNAGGWATFYIPIPNQRLYNDLIVSSQAACFDFFAPGGVVVSNGDQIEFGIDPAMGVLWSQGSPTAQSGSYYPHYGLVTLFAHN